VLSAKVGEVHTINAEHCKSEVAVHSAVMYSLLAQAGVVLAQTRSEVPVPALTSNSLGRCSGQASAHAVETRDVSHCAYTVQIGPVASCPYVTGAELWNEEESQPVKSVQRRSSYSLLSPKFDSNCVFKSQTVNAAHARSVAADGRTVVNWVFESHVVVVLHCKSCIAVPSTEIHWS
jgi:hypothetical protein